MTGYNVSHRRQFGHRMSGAEFAQRLAVDPSSLVAFVLEAGALHVDDLRLRTPADELGRVAALFGTPIHYGGSDTACDEITNSANTPLIERNKAVEWHQDDIYTPVAANFTLLYCLEAPTPAPATMFADLRNSFDDLSDLMRDRLRDLRVTHDPVGGIVGLPTESVGRFGNKPGANPTHPLVLIHPLTGAPQLFAFSGTAAGIVGMADEEARTLLLGLKEFALMPQYRFEPRLCAADLLIWDNLSAMHSATPVEYSDDDGQRRRVLRVAVRSP